MKRRGLENDAILKGPVVQEVSSSMTNCPIQVLPYTCTYTLLWLIIINVCVCVCFFFFFFFLILFRFSTPHLILMLILNTDGGRIILKKNLVGT